MWSLYLWKVSLVPHRAQPTRGKPNQSSVYMSFLSLFPNLFASFIYIYIYNISFFFFLIEKILVLTIKLVKSLRWYHIKSGRIYIKKKLINKLFWLWDINNITSKLSLFQIFISVHLLSFNMFLHNIIQFNVDLNKDKRVLSIHILLLIMIF